MPPQESEVLAQRYTQLYSNTTNEPMECRVLRMHAIQVLQDNCLVLQTRLVIA
jgi:hypothetical protein